MALIYHLGLATSLAPAAHEAVVPQHALARKGQWRPPICQTTTRPTIPLAAPAVYATAATSVFVVDMTTPVGPLKLCPSTYRTPALPPNSGYLNVN